MMGTYSIGCGGGESFLQNAWVEVLMSAGRGGEPGQTWFRSDRVFNCNGQWYFHTREGVDVGPYESQLEAEIEASMLKELIKNSHLTGEALGVLRDFILESFTLGRPLNVMIADDGEHIELERPSE